MCSVLTSWVVSDDGGSEDVLTAGGDTVGGAGLEGRAVDKTMLR